MATGQHRHARRRADRGRAIGAVEDDPVHGELIKVWCAHEGIAVTAGDRRIVLVGVDVQKVRPLVRHCVFCPGLTQPHHPARFAHCSAQLFEVRPHLFRNLSSGMAHVRLHLIRRYVAPRGSCRCEDSACYTASPAPQVRSPDPHSSATIPAPVQDPRQPPSAGPPQHPDPSPASLPHRVSHSPHRHRAPPPIQESAALMSELGGSRMTAG